MPLALVAALLKDIKGPRLPNYKRVSRMALHLLSALDTSYLSHLSLLHAQALLQHFVRSLHRKALSLLQYAYSHAAPRRESCPRTADCISLNLACLQLH